VESPLKSDQESEYFQRREAEKKARLKSRLEAEAVETARLERFELHFNHCGKCGGDLEIHVFKGVEIDVCPDCGSVLLDPGELEELAGEDRSSSPWLNWLRGLNSSKD
jgi:hypothetical protein